MVAEVVLRMDSRYRVVLGKDIREKLEIRKGEKLIAVPFSGGVVIFSEKGRGFAGSLSGFHFEEEKHEATRYLRRMGKDANP